MIASTRARGSKDPLPALISESMTLRNLIIGIMLRAPHAKIGETPEAHARREILAFFERYIPIERPDHSMSRACILNIVSELAIVRELPEGPSIPPGPYNPRALK